MTKKSKSTRRPTNKKVEKMDTTTAKTKAEAEDVTTFRLGEPPARDEESSTSRAVLAMPEQLQGAYANFVSFGHTEHEFLMDFFFSAPNDRPRLVSRIIMSPGMAKRLKSVVDENVGRFEKSYGPITK